jgi:outer membrane protein assembly factor BamB
MKHFFIITTLFLLILVATTNVAADGQAWKFRSDLNNSGIYDDGGTRPDGTLIWNYTAGDWIQSTPAVAGGIVYVGSHDDNVYALDAETGALIWSYTTESNVWPSPAVAGGIVYTGDYASNVYALDAETGALIWSYKAGGSITSSPAVADGVVYVGSHDRKVYALDAETGAFIWSYTTGREVDTCPAVVDGVVYVGSYDNRVYALDASSGAHIWNFTTQKGIRSSPAVANGTVYFGSWDHDVYAVDASTGALLWNYTTGGDIFSSVAVANGVAYVGSDDCNLYALDASTGALLWNYTTGNGVSASPAVANGIVYARSHDSNLYAFDEATGTLLWNSPVGEGGFSSPVVANGIVYFGDLDGNLYAIGSSPENPPAYDDFDDNVCNSTLWDILEYGGPYVNETDQRLEITLPSDSSGANFFAGYTSKCALRGDFDVCVDYHLLTWPSNNGVRAGLWIERSPSTYTVERASYGISDGFTPGDHYTTNFADSILLSVTHDTDGKLRLVRTGTTFEGYSFDDISHDWVLSQSIQGDVLSSRDVTFMIKAWSHDYAFGDELVTVAFDNFVINKGELVPFSPPTGVTNLQNATYQPTQIRCTWSDPGSIDFSHVMVYLDGVFQANVTAGTEAWTAKDLAPSTAYTIGTRTVGISGRVNETWVNHTATTSSLLVTHLDPPDVLKGSPGFTLDILGSGFGAGSRVLWNGDEQPTQFYDAGHLSIDVSAGMISHSALVNITVHDSITGEFSNPEFFSVRDNSSGVKAWKFRSDSSNSGVYDDNGTRPGNELLWKYMTESYYGSSPAVADGVVYICGIYDTNAIDAVTGKLLWTSPAGGGWSSPAVADNVVYVGSTDRNVSALDASTGALLWQYRTGGVVYSSPAVAEGTVYAGSWDYHLYALDATTGALRWDYPTGDEVRSSPAVANGVVYFGSHDHNVYALDADTGSLLWNYTTGGELFYSSPAVTNGVVYVQSSDGNLYALDALSGALFWTYPVTGWGDSCPAMANGVVYIGSDDGNLYAIDAGTGDLIWNYTTGELVRSSPSVANGVVYFGNNGGNLYAIDAGTGDLIWTYATDEAGFTNPAIAHGVVYAQGYSGYLYALTTLPDDPPESVTDLHATTVNGVEITWTWTDPETLGFSHVMVYLDGVFQENVTAGTVTWTAEGLSPSTAYTIGTKTTGVKGAINATLMSHTATTGTLSISSLDPATVMEDSPAFTLNIYGTGFTPACTILWDGEEQTTQYLQPDHLGMEVPAEYVAHSGRVSITVHDQVSGGMSNSVVLPVTDNPETGKARKFRSDLNNSGVYDDGGRRPVPTLLWTFQTGAPVTSSPSLVDGVVYIGSQDRNLYALNRTTGAFLWKYNTMERNDYVSSSPAVSNGVVYIGGLKTKIHAVDAYSGELLWKYNLPIRSTTRSGVSSSAAVADGIVYIGNMDGTLYAFEEEDGDLLWRYAIPRTEYDEHMIFSSPAVADGVVFIQTYGGNLYALDASTGALRWNYLAEGDYSAFSSPAVAEGVVYAGSGMANTFRAFDAHTGALLWVFPTGGSIGSSPAVANGVVYFGCNDNITYALNASTGSLLWNFTAGWRVSSSPAVANGVVYFGSYDNNTYALDASTGALLWSYTTGGRVSSSPAVAHGIVYFGDNDGNVYAIGLLPLDPPIADFSANVTSGDAPLDVLFTDTSTGVVTTRLWDFGDGTTAWANDTVSLSHTYLFPGTFTVSLTTANVDGQDTVTKEGYIQVSPSGRTPAAWFTASPISGYGPLTVRFIDRTKGSPTAWRWDFGDGNTSSEQSPVHTYTATGKYTPRLTALNSGGSTSYSSLVWVRERPVIPTFTPTPTITPKPTIPPIPGFPPIAFFAMNRSFGSAPLTVLFNDMSFRGPTTWQWDFGDGESSTLRNPVHSFANPGTYPVSLTVTNANGQSTTSRNVYVR